MPQDAQEQQDGLELQVLVALLLIRVLLVERDGLDQQDQPAYLVRLLILVLLVPQEQLVPQA